MLEQQQIDPLRFARAGERRAGRIPIAAMPRLADVVRDSTGDVVYEVAGRLDERGRPAIVVRVRGRLALTCQRCLGSLAHECASESTLLLAASEAELPSPEDDEEDADWIDGREPLDLADLVEQEVVLALPFAPLHDTDACAPVGARQAPDRDGDSPFAGLARLKTEAGETGGV